MCNTSRDIIRYFSTVASEDPAYKPSALDRPCLGRLLFRATFFSCRFLTIILLLFWNLILPLASPLLYGIHTSCMVSPFPAVHTIDGPLYFEAKWLNDRSVVIDRPLGRSRHVSKNALREEGWESRTVQKQICENMATGTELHKSTPTVV